MIIFELDNTKEGINICINNDGVDELVHYLNFIKKNGDHIHLISGNELSDKVIEPGSTLIKHVRIGFFGE